MTFANRPLDIILLGRVAIDFNPVDYFKPLDESTTFKKYLGGSPANIAVGLARLGKKAGFVGTVSDDQFGKYVTGFFAAEGIDTSHISVCKNGEKLGLTFTEILSNTESSILMYRNCVADLQLSPDEVDEEYIASAKLLLISGTALAASPSREAALKALALAKKTYTPVVFDIDYRPYNWSCSDETAVYYSIVAAQSDLILGSREEFDLTERFLGLDGSDAATAAHWQKSGARIVIVKHGKQGSTAYTRDGSYSIKPFPTKALKSFGGGDGYASAFLFGLLQGWDMWDCLEFGSASASILVASHACSQDMPGEDAVKEYIRACKLEYGEQVARG